eukprot:s5621_g2.t1
MFIQSHHTQKQAQRAAGRPADGGTRNDNAAHDATSIRGEQCVRRPAEPDAVRPNVRRPGSRAAAPRTRYGAAYHRLQPSRRHAPGRRQHGADATAEPAGADGRRDSWWCHAEVWWTAAADGRGPNDACKHGSIRQRAGGFHDARPADASAGRASWRAATGRWGPRAHDAAGNGISPAAVAAVHKQRRAKRQRSSAQPHSEFLSSSPSVGLVQVQTHQTLDVYSW